ncbi:MAG: hypothetical protein LBQ79_14780 [Deltaproteobacteria bacterium]|nr:hypothetical protein [Deltaproteobacteria bacterium]
MAAFEGYVFKAFMTLSPVAPRDSVDIVREIPHPKRPSKILDSLMGSGFFRRRRTTGR